MYEVEKDYGFDLGLSCCFRQWKAVHSHCSQLHGYSIGVRPTFVSPTLDDCNWVYDYGGLKEFKEWLKQNFDHTTIIAEDDPELFTFQELHVRKIIDLRVFPDVGCEKFAEHIYNNLNQILNYYKEPDYDYWYLDGAKITKPNKLVNKNVKLKSIRVAEHTGNSATYYGTI